MTADLYYTAEQCRAIDRLAIEQGGIPGFTLMQRAGAAAFDALTRQWPDTTSVEIFCGTGNKGGDGLVLAVLAAHAGLKTMVHMIGDPDRIEGEALKALWLARENMVPMNGSGVLTDAASGTVVVDALLGTGLSGEVRSPYRDAIAAINASKLPVLAIDIPSGLSSDTGEELGICVQADLTVTFIGRKLGLVRGKGPRVCGRVEFASLGVPDALYDQVTGTPA